MERSNPIKRILSVRGAAQVLTVTFGLVIICIVLGIINPVFFSWTNITNLLRQIAPFLIVGIGQSYVLITGNIDLSIGSVVGMSSMISATMMSKGTSPIVAMLVTLIAALATGIVNGQLVARFKLPPFIATLGTMMIARGVAQIVNNNYNTNSIGQAAQGFKDFFYYGKTIGLYNTIYIAVVLWIVFNFLLSRTRSGRHIYAIGSNLEAASLSGVNVVNTTTKAYMVSAFCAYVVGLITCATAGQGSMDAGTSYEMYAVAASVIGGISTLGGQGLLIGTVVGASIWSVLQNGLQFAKASVGIRNIVIGVIVVISVLLDVVVRTGRDANRRLKWFG